MMAFRFLIPIIVCVTTMLSHGQASVLEMRALSQSLLSGELSHLDFHFRAVGLISFDDKRGVKFRHNGFFIKPNLFITAVPTTTTELNCGSVRIQIGNTDLNNAKDTQIYECQAVKEINPLYGYAIIQTKTMHLYSLPVILGGDQLHWDSNPLYMLLGYSPYDRMFLSNRCAADWRRCKQCKLFKTAPFAWMDGKCLNYTSMVGSPAIVIKNGYPKVAGLYGMLNDPNVPGFGVDDKVQIISLTRLKRVSLILNQIKSSPPTCELSADPDIIKMGEATTLSLMVNGEVEEYAINGVLSGQLPTEGVLQVTPSKTTLFKAVIAGEGGSSFCLKKVEVQVVPAPICRLRAKHPSIKRGEATLLQYEIEGEYQQITIGGQILKDRKNDSAVSVSPKVSKIYQAKVVGVGGEGVCQTQVTVTKIGIPTCTLHANPQTVLNGNPTTLSMTTFGDVSSAAINGVLTNSLKLVPELGKTYIGKVVGPGGSSLCKVKLEVRPAPKPFCTLITKPSTIVKGQSLEITILAHEGSKLAIFQGKEYLLSETTTPIKIIRNPQITTNYSAQVIGHDGTIKTCRSMVTVTNPNKPDCVLTATPAEVAPGEPTLLELSSSTVDQVNQFSIEGKNVRKLQVFPQTTQQYIGKVEGPSGTVLCKVQVGVH